MLLVAGFDTMMDTQKVKNKLYKLWRDSRSYTTRLWVALCAVLAFGYTFLFFGPLELTAFSGGSLPFGYGEVLWPLVGLLVLFTCVLSPVLALLRGRLFNYGVMVLAVCAVGGWLQALLCNSGLGLLTGDSIDWHNMGPQLWGSLALWAAVALAFMLGMYLSRRVWERAVKLICLALVAVQLVPTFAILGGAYDETAPDELSSYHLTDKGFYQLSKNENILVIVLDRLDYDYIEQILREDPSFFDDLDGFTSYTNAISGYARTKPALAHMLTGNDQLAYTVSAQDYYDRVWEESENSILQPLHQKGYSISLYARERNLFSTTDAPLACVDNFSDGTLGMNRGVAVQKLLQLSAFRYAPTAIKPFVWADTNYYNEGILVADTHQAYNYDDAAYGAGFADTQAVAESPCFKLYHFFGPHNPYTLTAEGTVSQESTSAREQAMGCFALLQELFGQMKRQGIYDDATIIITGDHGAAMYDTKPLVKATRVGLFYKPAGASGTALQHSAAPVTTGQIAATVLKAAGCDYTGPALDEVAEDAQVVRHYYKTVCDTTTYRETQMAVYEVRGDAADFKNWQLVETRPIDYNYN